MKFAMLLMSLSLIACAHKDESTSIPLKAGDWKPHMDAGQESFCTKVAGQFQCSPGSRPSQCGNGQYQYYVGFHFTVLGGNQLSDQFLDSEYAYDGETLYLINNSSDFGLESNGVANQEVITFSTGCSMLYDAGT